jgi:hypothetical protein
MLSEVSTTLETSYAGYNCYSQSLECMQMHSQDHYVRLSLLLQSIRCALVQL